MTASNPRKTEADALYRKKKYGEAATAYSAALKLEPHNEKIYSNRAACCEQLCKELWGPEKQGWLTCGLGDARKCQELAPEWPKAHARVVAACVQKCTHEKDSAWERDDYDEEAAARSIGKTAGPSQQIFSRSCREECSALKREAEDACRRGLAYDASDLYLRAALNKLRDDADYVVRKEDTYPSGKYASDASLQKTEPAGRLKQKGNDLFEKKMYPQAEKAYSDALAFDPLDAVLYSNRSACRVHQDEYRGALRDAEKCVKYNPDWAKGYLRLANALFGLGDYIGAEQACGRGLAIDPEHSALSKLQIRLKVETKEPLEVQREMHRLREDQRHRGSLKKTLKGLREHGGGAGPDISKGIEEMMSKMGMPRTVWKSTSGLGLREHRRVDGVGRLKFDSTQASRRRGDGGARHGQFAVCRGGPAADVRGADAPARAASRGREASASSGWRGRGGERRGV
jgi:tetratricopeptide (TPR) repeat protein